MHITRVEPLLVDRFLFVRIHTTEGLVGLGEVGLWAHHRVVHQALVDLAETLVGHPANRMDHLYQAITRNAHFPSPVLHAALSAIDIALWDIQGKALNRPVHDLLGGRCRDRVRVFASIGGATVEEHAENARQAVAQGFTSLRSMPFLPNWETETPTQYISTAAEIVQAIRDTVDYGIDLGVELHRNFGPDESIILAREIAPLRILYYEDPVAPESVTALKYVAEHVDIPIAAGERCHSLFQFKELMDTVPLAMIRPDLSLAGGFTQCRKIAALAEAGFVKVFPHLMGSHVNLAAFVQFAASIPNYALMEGQASLLPEIVDHPLTVHNGYVEVPNRPGIGLTLRDDVLAQYPYRPHLNLAALRPDGSVAH